MIAGGESCLAKGALPQMSPVFIGGIPQPAFLPTWSDRVAAAHPSGSSFSSGSSLPLFADWAGDFPMPGVLKASHPNIIDSAGDNTAALPAVADFNLSLAGDDFLPGMDDPALALLSHFSSSAVPWRRGGDDGVDLDALRKKLIANRRLLEQLLFDEMWAHLRKGQPSKLNPIGRMMWNSKLRRLFSILDGRILRSLDRQLLERFHRADERIALAVLAHSVYAIGRILHHGDEAYSGDLDLIRRKNVFGDEGWEALIKRVVPGTRFDRVVNGIATLRRLKSSLKGDRDEAALRAEIRNFEEAEGDFRDFVADWHWLVPKGKSDYSIFSGIENRIAWLDGNMEALEGIMPGFLVEHTRDRLFDLRREFLSLVEEMASVLRGDVDADVSTYGDELRRIHEAIGRIFERGAYWADHGDGFRIAKDRAADDLMAIGDSKVKYVLVREGDTLRLVIGTNIRLAHRDIGLFSQAEGNKENNLVGGFLMSKDGRLHFDRGSKTVCMMGGALSMLRDYLMVLGYKPDNFVLQ